MSTPSGGASRLATWHQELFAAVERWPWLQALNDSVSGGRRRSTTGTGAISPSS